MANLGEQYGSTSFEVRRHELGQSASGLKFDSGVVGAPCDKVFSGHVGSERSSVDFVNESAGRLRDPVELVREIIGCGVSPDGAVTVAQSYYAAVGQACSLGCSSSASGSAVSRASSRRHQRTLRWQQDMLTLPDTPGQCYLEVVRFGRRRSLLKVLGQNPGLRDFVTALGHDALDMVAAREFKVYKLPSPMHSVAAYHVARDYDGCCIGTVYDVVARVLVLIPTLNMSLSLPSPNDAGVVVDLDAIVGWSVLLPAHGQKLQEPSRTAVLSSGISLPIEDMPYKPSTPTPYSRMYMLPRTGSGFFPFKESPSCAFGPLHAQWSLVVVRGPCEVFAQGYRFSVSPALPVFFLAPRGCKFALWYFDWQHRPPDPVYSALQGPEMARWFLRFGIADPLGERGLRDQFNGVVACAGVYAQQDDVLPFGEHSLPQSSVAWLGSQGESSVQLRVVGGPVCVDSCLYVDTGQVVCYLDLGNKAVKLCCTAKSQLLQIGVGPVYRRGLYMPGSGPAADQPKGWWSWF